MLIGIISFVIGYAIGCYGYKEAIKEELRKCKTLHEQIRALERMKIIERKGS